MLTYNTLSFVPQVDMTKVVLDTLKPWVTTKITEILGFEDDVVIEFIFNQLEERVSCHLSINLLRLNSQFINFLGYL